ncbi:tetraacyldisaccharide 4'-kinase [Aminobacter niigataensis]|uniref:tetraacyldisaccharide 4'-kinase n=1 Tax=Aminobacter niigataensis TaxID=83265 RepID=UPI0016057160|nr:tetraacyldisaccharide 4'-kinase [Aminobacter niigataensis]
MASEAPPFWWEKPDWRAYALYPVSSLYAFVAGRRMKSARREKMDAPVLCVGNFTVGGTGKTPIAIALARQAKRMQLVPGFLSRGHGGSFAEPHVVDTHHDSAKHVGDEPLLLAEHALVAVSANRAAGARLLIERGCNFLIMDDGFQSARIHIDYALIVVDARFGLGNGHVIPGGPMRARLIDQLRFADAILKMGEGERADPIVRQAARAGKPVFSATARPRGKKAFAGRRFLAFAGIGHPEKFFDTVGKAGGTVVLAHAFADHHFYLPDELDDLVAAADAGELELLTTSKDAARLRHGAASPEFLERLNVLEIDAVFDIELSAERIVDETLDAWRRRKIAG